MAWLLAGAAIAADAGSSTVFGPDPALADGARALRLRDFETGTQLTLEGLKREVSPQQRAKAYSNLCAGFTALRRFADAIDACDQALSLEPRNWRAYNNRALAWLGQDQLAAARNDVEAGLAMHPDSPTLHKVMDLLRQREAIVRLAANP